MPRISPPLQQEKLGRELRALRTAAGLTIAQAADRLHCANSTVSNMENGHTLVTPGYVRDVLDVYDADEPTRRRCLDLLTDAHRKPWWHPQYRRVLGRFVVYETEARLLRYWQAQVVPGLLQTLDYAREVIAADRPWEEDGLVQLRARARIARQWVLTDEADPLVVDAIVSEEALRRPVGGPDVMAAQLTRLLDAGARPTVSVRVVPRSVGAHAGLTCSFVLFSMQDLPTILYREGGIDEIVDAGLGVAEEYERRFEHLAGVALPARPSAELIESIREEFVCTGRALA
ncbi:Helix-turn-helix domain-containing protein [Nonomuraea solani]|uniref:Helix-turn-helix domain-containing protein n=1 Tax=Nonomuraea solani TaxID=1144553 RepID=A0A1H6EUD3_9ACTN|nr:helix-turn-helix transcriptional regulator [Nonomuraea solani]SEH01438.1 Helix-turn-helix domain-containing protein [Nonomuraea solani]